MMASRPALFFMTWLLATGVARPVVAEQAMPPAAPVAPATIVRDSGGRATVRAIRLSEPLRLDGRLEEEVYRTVEPFGDFVQALPREGAPASERTDVWVMFDQENVYIAARLWDSAPPEQWVANEMRRDTAQLGQNDNFSFLFDTFHDRRNGYLFQTNPLGARADFAMSDESNVNRDWNPVWDVRSGRFEGGWTVEAVVPFKSLRYRPGTDRSWGLQLRRVIRRRNEFAYLNPVPAQIGGPQGLQRISLAAPLVGIETPDASRNVEVKPYAIASLASDRLRTPAMHNDVTGDAGIDAKYSITANLTADVTYNTDFAQVEVDEQQVNLTRFSLFFPEKRDFFLEGRGVFDFGRVAAGGDTPSLFYSRRIGLNRGRAVPLNVGGRLTGKAGKFGLGLMNIQTGDEQVAGTPATNFTVLRIKRDILRRSSIGAIVTSRSRSNVARGSNQAVGVDAAFSFFQTIIIDGYAARTRTPGVDRDEGSYQSRFDYNADRYGARVEHVYVGDNFNPEAGFVRRDNFRRTSATARFSPRPMSIAAVRKFTLDATLDYILNGGGALETRQQTGRFVTELESSDQLTFEASRNYELLVAPFAIARRVTIPSDGYSFADAQVTMLFGQQRRASGSLSLQAGQFYDGTIAAFNYTASRISISDRLSMEPATSITRVDLPAGQFTTTLLRTRADLALSPRMFASALLQYNTVDTSFSSNLRFRWEYLPGSELFVVYTDERDTTLRGFPFLRNRAFVVKINRLMQF
jgi:hypothetical protein